MRLGEKKRRVRFKLDLEKAYNRVSWKFFRGYLVFIFWVLSIGFGNVKFVYVVRLILVLRIGFRNFFFY